MLQLAGAELGVKRFAFVVDFDLAVHEESFH